MSESANLGKCHLATWQGESQGAPLTAARLWIKKRANCQRTIGDDQLKGRALLESKNIHPQPQVIDIKDLGHLDI